MSEVRNNRSRSVIGFRMSSRTVFGMPIPENGTVTFRGKTDNNWRKLTAYILLLSYVVMGNDGAAYIA